MLGLCKIVSSTLRSQLNCIRFTRSFSKNVTYNPKATRFDNSFIIVRVCPKDYERVIDLFRYSYFNEEPTMVAAGLAYKHNPVLEGRLLKSLEQGMSLMAVCRRTGAICGAAVNSGICPWDADAQDDFANTCTCHKVAELLRLHAHITRAANVWEKYKEYKVFEITHITVDINNQGKKLGYNLVKKSIDLAKDLTYNVVRLDATSYYSAKICEKLKMTMVHELPYKKYVDCDGKPLFLPPSPHDSVKVYVALPHVGKK